MSTSYHVYGFRPPDTKWIQMKRVYDACVEADIPVPDNVYAFFDYAKPDDLGVQVDLKPITTEWQNDDEWGCELELSKLPLYVKTIRFQVEW